MKTESDGLHPYNCVITDSAEKCHNKIQKQPPEVFLEISKNSQENTCARVSFLIKLQASGQQLY